MAYANDLLLIAPSASAMRKMLIRVCDNFPDEFSVKFNANKSKCLVIQLRSAQLPTGNIGFIIGGNEIEIVDRWPHLRHMITKRLDDDADIMNRRNCMVGISG